MKEMSKHDVEAGRPQRGPRVNLLAPHPVGWGVGCTNCETDGEGVVVITLDPRGPLAHLVP